MLIDYLSTGAVVMPFIAVVAVVVMSYVEPTIERKWWMFLWVYCLLMVVLSIGLGIMAIAFGVQAMRSMGTI